MIGTVEALDLARELGSLGLLAYVVLRLGPQLVRTLEGMRGQLHALSVIVVQRLELPRDVKEQTLRVLADTANGHDHENGRE